MNTNKSNIPRNGIILLILCFIFLSSGDSLAQKKIELINGVEVKLRSKVLNEDRIMSIFLPADYDTGTRKYPVLYLLDGETHFHHTTGAVNYLTRQGIIPQIIIVAIHNVDRNRDFSPAYDERIPTSGGAEKFLTFISDELTGYINANYRTSDFTILVGHSFGGEFTTYALLEKPELFDAYIAISPYLLYADRYVVKEAAKKLRSDYDNKKIFYMTVGDEPEYYSSLDEFSDLIEERSNEIIDFKYSRMESEDHTTIPYLSVFNGLKYVFSDWRLPLAMLEKGLKALDDHYAALSVKYGIEISTPENVINLLGYNYLQKQDIKNAITVFAENVKRYPGSSNVYDSLGEAYETNGQIELARENYQKAYDLGKEQNHVNTSVYLKNLKRVQQ